MFDYEMCKSRSYSKVMVVVVRGRVMVVDQSGLWRKDVEREGGCRIYERERRVREVTR